MDISVNIDIWWGSGLTALYGEVLHEYIVAINFQYHIVEVFFLNRNMPVQTKKSKRIFRCLWKMSASSHWLLSFQGHWRSSRPGFSF